MNWSGRKVLVTGAAGFIGSHLTEDLVSRGARVRAFIHYNSRSDIGLLKYLPSSLLREVELAPGDLRDADAVTAAASTVEIIFHLGALTGIPYSYLNPRDVIATNIMGTLNVLVAARQQEVQRLVHTSSSEVYGSALTDPITEEHRLKAQSPYSASKIAADKLVESFHLSYGLPSCTIRPFNTYGPRQSDRAVIPTIISQALTGPEIRLGALWPRRDYTFVSDTVNGFILGAESADAVGTEINLGTGEDVSIGDLAMLILGLLNRDVPICEDARRIRPERSEVKRLVSSNERARRLLGWQPSTPVREGLLATIQWVKEHPDLYLPNSYRV